MRVAVAVVIDGADRHLRDSVIAPCPVKQHVRLVFVACAAHRQHEGNKPVGKRAQSCLGIAHIFSRCQEKGNFCIKVAEPVAQRHLAADGTVAQHQRPGMRTGTFGHAHYIFKSVLTVRVGSRHRVGRLKLAADIGKPCLDGRALSPVAAACHNLRVSLCLFKQCAVFLSAAVVNNDHGQALVMQRTSQICQFFIRLIGGN